MSRLDAVAMAPGALGGARTLAHLHDRPGIRADVVATVLAGSCIAANVVAVLVAAFRSRMPIVIEAPDDSICWTLPTMKHFVGSHNARSAVADMCCYGQGGHGRLRFVGWFCGAATDLDRRCMHTPRCPFSCCDAGRRYPAIVARMAARWLVRGADRREQHRLLDLICG